MIKNGDWEEIKELFAGEFIKPTYNIKTMPSGNLYDLLAENTGIDGGEALWNPKWIDLLNVSSVSMYTNNLRRRRATIEIVYDTKDYTFDWINNTYQIKVDQDPNNLLNAIGKSYIVAIYQGAIDPLGNRKICRRMTGIVSDISIERGSRTKRTIKVTVEDFGYIFSKQLMYNYPDLHSYQTAEEDHSRIPNRDVVEANKVVPAYDNWLIKDVFKDVCRKIGFPLGLVDSYINKVNFRMDYGEMYPFLIRRQAFMTPRETGTGSPLDQTVTPLVNQATYESSSPKDYVGINIDGIDDAIWRTGFGDNVWDFLLKVADSVGYSLYFDEYGKMVFRPVNSFYSIDSSDFITFGHTDRAAIDDEIHGWNIKGYKTVPGVQYLPIFSNKYLTSYGLSLPKTKYLTNHLHDAVVTSNLRDSVVGYGEEEYVQLSLHSKLSELIFIERNVKLTSLLLDCAIPFGVSGDKSFNLKIYRVYRGDKEPRTDTSPLVDIDFLIEDNHHNIASRLIDLSNAGSLRGGAWYAFVIDANQTPINIGCNKEYTAIDGETKRKCLTWNLDLGEGVPIGELDSWVEKNNLRTFYKLEGRPQGHHVVSEDITNDCNGVSIDIYRKKTSGGSYQKINTEPIHLPYSAYETRTLIVERGLELDNYDIAIAVVSGRIAYFDAVIYTDEDAFVPISEMRSSININSLTAEYGSKEIKNDITVLGNLEQKTPLKHRGVDEVSIYGGYSIRRLGKVERTTAYYLDHWGDVISSENFDGSFFPTKNEKKIVRGPRPDGTIYEQSTEHYGVNCGEIEFTFTEPTDLKKIVLYLNDFYSEVIFSGSDKVGYISVYWSDTLSGGYTESNKKIIRWDGDYKVDFSLFNEVGYANSNIYKCKAVFGKLDSGQDPYLVSPTPIEVSIYDYDLYNWIPAPNKIKFPNQMVVYDSNINLSRKVKWLAEHILTRYRRNLTNINIRGLGDILLEPNDCVDIIDSQVGLTGSARFWISEIEDKMTLNNYETTRMSISSLPPIESYTPYPNIPEPYSKPMVWYEPILKQDYIREILGGDITKHAYYDADLDAVDLTKYDEDGGFFDVYSTEFRVNIANPKDQFVLIEAIKKNPETMGFEVFTTIQYAKKYPAGIFTSNEATWDCGVNFLGKYGPYVQKKLFKPREGSQREWVGIKTSFYDRLGVDGKPISPTILNPGVYLGSDKEFVVSSIVPEKGSFQKGELIEANAIVQFKEKQINIPGYNNLRVPFVSDFVELSPSMQWVFLDVSVHGSDAHLVDIGMMGQYNQSLAGVHAKYYDWGPVDSIEDLNVGYSPVAGVTGMANYFRGTTIVPKGQILNSSGMPMYLNKNWWAVEYKIFDNTTHSSANVVSMHTYVGLLRFYQHNYFPKERYPGEIKLYYSLTHEDPNWVLAQHFKNPNSFAIDHSRVFHEFEDAPLNVARVVVLFQRIQNTFDLTKYELNTRVVNQGVPIAPGMYHPSFSCLWDGIKTRIGDFAPTGSYFFYVGKMLDLQHVEYEPKTISSDIVFTNE